MKTYSIIDTLQLFQILLYTLKESESVNHSVCDPKAPLSMGLPFPSPADLSNPGIEPASPALQADSLLSEPPGKQVSLPAVALAPNAAQPQASSAAALSLCTQFYLTACLFPWGQVPTLDLSVSNQVSI